jgi:hypothetical protein
MARTPKRLFGPALLTNVTATKYTVPALTKTIIRHIHVTNPSAGTVNLTVSIGADAAGTRIFDAYPIAAYASLDFYGYWVLDVAEILAAFGSSTNVLNLTCNGDEITLG